MGYEIDKLIEHKYKDNPGMQYNKSDLYRNVYKDITLILIKIALLYLLSRGYLYIYFYCLAISISHLSISDFLVEFYI